MNLKVLSRKQCVITGFPVLNLYCYVVSVAEWLATHSRGVNFAGGEIGTSRCGSLHRFVGVVTDLGARSHDTSCESYS